ncbi:MAG: hypothetical protein A2491_09090 [Bacteroidetes bacterium RIFOXYC12_FULL_35_7]|nr:MAG: hypothetical protein A2491_09090 [Bacteroidetes bacterium RIFOXYC12_FULL_35_7]
MAGGNFSSSFFFQDTKIIIEKKRTGKMVENRFIFIFINVLILFIVRAFIIKVGLYYYMSKLIWYMV